MTTYDASAVSNTVIAYKKSITMQIVRQLRDNPLAMFEGAAGAPRLQFEAMDTWYSTAGAVGSYVFAAASTVDKTFGVTIAGSSLFPTSAAYAMINVGTGGPSFDTGLALSGTWQCMGRYDYTNVDSSMTILGATLWQRIA